MKKALKRSLSILLAITIIFSSVYSGLSEVNFSDIFAVNPFKGLIVKSEAASEEDLTFTLNEDGESYSVSDCDELAEGEIVIPETYNSLPVTSIGNSAFYNCTSLTAIEVPDSITSVGNAVFRGCKEVKSIIIPDSVESIGNAVFYGCTSLERVEISDGVKTIGNAVFRDCTNLTDVVIPESVISIGTYTFSGCTSLANVFYAGNESAWATVTIATNNDALSSAAIHYNATDHTYSTDWSVDVEPTCTEVGSKSHHCTVCGDKKDITAIDIVPHSYSTEWTVDVEPTCTEVGSKSHHCTVCGDKKDITAIDFAPHTYSTEWTVDVEPTCTKKGSQSHHCTVCGDKKDVTVIEATGHNYVEVVTTLHPHTTSQVCSFCNDEIILDKQVLADCVECNFTIAEIDENSYKLVSYIGTATDVVIPSEYNGIAITQIYDKCFENNTAITSVVIPNSITSIGYRAFYGCTGITSVTIPDSVTSIGTNAFSNCTSLTGVYITELAAWCNISFGGISANPLYYAKKLYVNGELATSLSIPDGATRIGDYAFYGCTDITSVIIPDSVTSIGGFAFYDCTGLTSVTIPDNVTSIGSYAFSGCTGLTSVTIGKGVTSIGTYVFNNCTALEKLYWNAVSVADYSSEYSCGFYKAGTSGSGIEVVFGDGVEKIPAYLFATSSSSYAPNLKSVTIPDSVTSIGSGAFKNCTSLTGVYITDFAAWLDIEFGSSTANPLYYAKKLYINGELSTTIVIPEGTTSIGAYAFEGCTGITSVTIPDSVTSIGTEAFYNCTGLAGVYITDLAAWCNISFGNGSANPLYYANNLYVDGKLVTALSIPDSVTSIGDYVFRGCTALTSVTIPDSVTSIGTEAFYNCTGLTGVYITDLAAWCKISFGNVSANPLYCAKNLYVDGKLVTTLSIPDTVTSIGDYAFDGCTSFTSITIPDSVTSIGYYAFGGCTGLTSVTIGKGVTSIGDRAFYGCTALEKLYWNAVSVADFTTSSTVFYKAGTSGSGIDVVFGDGVEKIPSYLFYVENSSYRPYVKSVTIPDSVTSIGFSAFYGCSKMTGVYITDLAAWCNIFFGGSSTNPLYYAKNLYVDGKLVTALSIPDSVTSIGSYAFNGCTGLTSVTIPDSVTSIGGSAFNGCTGLTSVTIPDSVTSIGYSAFDGCTGLTSVTIGKGVTSIGTYAFKNCTGLTSVTIPDSVITIESYAFEGCTGLTGVYITDLAAWCNISFGGISANPLYYAKKMYVNGKLVTALSIPDSVTSIGSYAFNGCTGLTSVTIPNSVTSIGYYAFGSCTGLTSLTIGSGVTSIGLRAFYGCTGLTSVIIPDSVTSIDDQAFYNCTGLTSVTIGKGVTSIGYYAFGSCTGLTSLTIGSGVTSVEEHAFNNCTALEKLYWNAVSVVATASNAFYNAGTSGAGIEVVFGDGVERIPANLFASSSYAPKLKSVTISNTVKSIGASAFYYCSKITGVYITDLAAWSATEFGDTYANPLYYAKKLYINGELATNVVIPEGVTSIDNNAFYNCTSITSVTIPDSVTSIGANAFYNCTGLAGVYITDLAAWCNISFDGSSANPLYYAKKLYVNGELATDISIPDGATSIGDYAFYNCTSIISVEIPGSVTSIGDYAFRNCTGLTSVTIPDSVTSIGDSAFYYCPSIISVEIPDSVTSIGEQAFRACTGLTSVTIPDSVTSIGNRVFEGCTGLTSVTIGKGVTSVGDSAFYGCTGLTSVTIPDSVTSIGYSAFRGCTSLTSVTIPDSVTSMGRNAFFNTAYYNDTSNWDNDVLYIGNHLIAAKTSLSGSCIIKKGTKTIADNAFQGCSSLTSVQIPDSITSISASAFLNCSGLTSVTIPDSVTSIGGSAFYNCTGLTSVTIPDGVTSISEHAFYNCTSLMSVTIGIGVTSIGDYAFRGCKKLKTIRLPETLINIGQSAFEGCGLTSVTIPDSVTSIEYRAFKECSGLTSVVLGGGIKEMGDSIFEDCTQLKSVEFNDGITTIGNRAFADCSALTSIDLPEGLTKIGSFAFNYCRALSVITFPRSLTYIGIGAFAYATGILTLYYKGTNKGFAQIYKGSDNLDLTDGTKIVCLGEKDSIDYLTFEWNDVSSERKVVACDPSAEGDIVIRRSYSNSSYIVTEIADSAFANCTGITSIAIPNSVEIIGDDAFKDCTNIEYVFFSGTEEQWQAIAMGSNNECLTNATIHYGCSGHIASEWTIDENATCLKEGTKHKECDVCGVSFNTVKIPVTTHQYPAKWTVDIAPTCTENGTKYRCCLGCGMKETGSLASTGHSYGEWVETKAPTCVETGVKQKTCNYCGDVIEESVALVDHSYGDWQIGVEPTCTQAGSRYRSCIVCGGVKEESTETVNEVVDSSLYPESSHDYGSSIFETYDFSYPGAETLRLTFSTSTNTESNFDYIKIYDSTGALYGEYTGTTLSGATIILSGDSFRIVLTSDGGVEYYGFSLASIVAVMPPKTVISPLGHNYSTEWTVDVEPTCTTAGSKSHHCSRCDSVTDVTVLEKLPHTYGEWIVDVEPNCTDAGSKHKICSGCYNVVTESIPAIGHVNTVWITEQEPTCIKDGYKDEYCLECAELINTETIPATGHLDTVWVIEQEPTCDTDGYKDEYCLNCGELVSSMTIAAIGHNYGEWVIDIEPTCTETGSKHKTCSVCGDVVTETVNTIDHNYSNEWTIDVAPTCTEEGSKSHHCTECGDKTDVTVVAATGHTYGGWQISVEPTCTEVGSKYKTCSVCDDVVTESVAATGHSYSTEWTVDVAPTCTEEGSKSHHCTECGDKTDVTVVAANGHTYGDWKISVEPTCTESGSKYKTCSVCGDVVTESVAATGHSYSTEWTIDIAPTCTEDGSKSHHCVDCDDVTDVTVIEALGHDYEVVSIAEEHPHTISYKCSRCDSITAEDSTSDSCGICNFSYTDNGDGTCKITGYIGTSSTFVIPATIDGKTVVTTTTGAFKNNSTFTSVEIEDGVQGLGALAFLGCKSLSKVVIPESVTTIGTNAFYNCASDFTIYCYRDSYAMQYAIENSHNYVIMDIIETENCTIDYNNKLIITTKNAVEDIAEILGVPATSTITTKASLVSGNKEFFGTGSTVTVTDGEVSTEYTLVVEGDTNGDSVCDIFDCFDVERASNGNVELSGVYAMAADSNSNDAVDATDYQSIVNKALAS